MVPYTPCGTCRGPSWQSGLMISSCVVGTVERTQREEEEEEEGLFPEPQNKAQAHSQNNRNRPDLRNAEGLGSGQGGEEERERVPYLSSKYKCFSGYRISAKSRMFLFGDPWLFSLASSLPNKVIATGSK